MANTRRIQEDTYNKLAAHVWEIATAPMPNWVYIWDDGWWIDVKPLPRPFFEPVGDYQDYKFLLTVGELDYDDPDAIYYDDDDNERYKTTWSKRKMVSMNELIDAYVSLLKFDGDSVTAPDTDTLLQQALMGEIKYA